MSTETAEPIEPSEQAAAVCYRLRNDQDAPVEFLLVRTKGRQDRWIFPKGRIKKGEPAWKAALREAHEEAGITLDEDSRVFLTQFQHRESLVDAFLFKAEAQHRPLEKHRQPRWFTAEKALGALSENRKFNNAAELKRVVRKAVIELRPSFPPVSPPPTPTNIRDQVFISYSHEDKEWLDKLRTMLAPLLRSQKIPLFDDIHIGPGDKWKKEIEKALKKARVAVLLVSPHFLESNFITEIELPSLLEAAEKEGLTILWIAVSHMLYEKTPLAEYQAANDPSVPLDACTPSDVNKHLRAICQTIEQAFNKE